MVGRRWIFGACVLLAGCNLLSGVADLATGPENGMGLDADAASRAAFGEGGGEDGGSESTSSPDARSDDARGSANDATLDASVDVDSSKPRPDGGLFVFVTSAQVTGDLKGIAGADVVCKVAAAGAGLGGMWTAWLTSNAGTGSSRLAGAGPWYLVTGELVASSKMQLASFGSLSHAIDRDELGTMRIGSPVWTGGMFALQTCTDWTSAAAGAGTTGSTQFATAEWQQFSTAACNTTHRLYCFED